VGHDDAHEAIKYGAVIYFVVAFTIHVIWKLR
jgi:hypothetical protein